MSSVLYLRMKSCEKLKCRPKDTLNTCNINVIVGH